MNSQQTGEAEDEPSDEKPLTRLGGVTGSQQIAADHQNVRGNDLAQRTAAEIYCLRGDGDGGRPDERSSRAIPSAAPQEAANDGRGREQGKNGCDDRQV